MVENLGGSRIEWTYLNGTGKVRHRLTGHGSECVYWAWGPRARLGKRYPDRLMVLLRERAMVLAASHCAAAVLVRGYFQQALPDRIE